MASACRLETAMDAIALATADGMMRDAKGAAGIDLAVELHCECPIHIFVVYCALTIEREQVSWRVREERPDTTAAEREGSDYPRVPFQSEAQRRNRGACHAGAL